LAAYLEGLAKAAGHRDRQQPLKDYCRGLLLPGERNSIEPMSARLHPDRLQAARQSLQHLVSTAPWSDEAVRAAVVRQLLPAMTRRQPVVAWIVDDTGIPKKGKCSVGVARQYCGQLGKQENCQVAVTLSLATWEASLPVAYRLYLPREWAEDRARRRRAGVVLADAGYGSDTRFRERLADMGLQDVVGVQGSVSVWRPGEAPLPPKARGRTGRPPKLLRRSKDHRPIAAREPVMEMGQTALHRDY